MPNEKLLDLINRRKLLAEMDKFANPMPNQSGHDFLCGIATAITEIEDAPTVDAVEVAEYDAVVEKLENLLCHATGGQYSKAGYSWEDMERMVTDYIEECCEEAIAEELVRCKDCKHRKEEFCFHENWWKDDGFTAVCENDFCSYGERKEESVRESAES